MGPSDSRYFLSHNTRTTIKNVKVHYAQGMGVLAQLCDDITMDGFGVCLKGENDSRYFTTQADATHFSQCKGKITSVNGLYEGMMDDAINVHGTYLKVIQQIDTHTLKARYMHDKLGDLTGDSQATAYSSSVQKPWNCWMERIV